MSYKLQAGADRGGKQRAVWRGAQHVGVDELPAHLLVGHFLKLRGQQEEAHDHFRKVVDALDASANRTQQGSGVEWSSETQLQYAWAMRELEGGEAATRPVRPQA